MSQLQPGTLLRDRYRIVGLIGKGGMGAVYLADDNRLKGRQCAIKEQIILETDEAETVRRQFEQEASILAQLDHPGLPKVSDYFTEEAGRRDYLVMDYVPGRNLAEVLAEHRRDGQYLAEETVLAWLNQLCDVLSYLHGRQPMVLHRDIKPANIKLTPEHRLKLVDFGLAKPFDPTDPRTITGIQGLGSLPYTPLEQYVGHSGHTDARADLYALGATTYHLLTGQPAASAYDRFLRAEALLDPQSLNPAISAGIKDAILWAMALHPDQRAPSVESWHAALRAGVPPHLGEPQTGTVAAAASTTPPETWSTVLRDNVFFLFIAALLLILALLITLL